MILRPRQIEFVDRCRTALAEHQNTLGIAPTGAGKSATFCAVAGGYQTSLILQHRYELVSQNRDTFRRVNPHIASDLFTADRKRFLNNGATFAMVPTLTQDRNLEKIQKVDLLVIDECHHAPSASYRKIISRVREINPNAHIFGVTATPSRADKKPLKEIFSNVADVISISELIHSGHLVRPRTFVIDCGLNKEIEAAREEVRRRRLQDFDMSQVEGIMDKSVVNERVFQEWRNIAGNRRTVIFCSTVEHAIHVAECFEKNGVRTGMVRGDMPDGERKRLLSDLDAGKIQVIVNVAVLVEGFDSQPLSCVVLLRPCSHKSTMLQMIGRGLRRVDPERYPGIIKDDCTVIDLGRSLLTHGSLETEVDLDPTKRSKPPVFCPGCETIVPASTLECPICGEVLRILDESAEPTTREATERGEIHEFVMTEIVDLLELSPYRWENLFGDESVFLANGIKAWAVCLLFRDRWHALGGGDNLPTQSLANTPEQFGSMAVADDFLRAHGDRDAARKSKEWLSLPASEKQLQHLGMHAGFAFGMSRYKASCLLTWRFNEKQLRQKLCL